MSGLRERKKAQTREAIRVHALRLIESQGFDATTVQQIAEAAGVSHMTFFRHFPTKESVVAQDDYDPALARQIAARPSGESVIDSVRHAVAAGLARIYASDRDVLLARSKLMLSTPGLRAAAMENQLATQELILAALHQRDGVAPDLRTRVLVGATLGALTTAVMVWVESDGETELPALIDDALAALNAP
jgi:AcrR family transcriptional regulator